MKSIADQLPPDIARQIHPDRRKNEAEYWTVRDQLLEQYRDQWIGVEFRQVSGSPGVVLDRVIPDTGADASVLPWTDCQQLQLTPALGVQGLISGVAGSSAATLAFLIWAHLDGREYPCRLQADFAGTERILGRDVLNRLEILFRGPAGEVVVNP
jgi:hypothetical protein